MRDTVATWLTATLLLLAAPIAATETLPLSAFHARFSVTAMGIAAGEAEFQLEPAEGGRWRFVARILPNVLARTLGVESQRQESLFRFEDGVVVPEEFVESRVRDETITSTASFEWSKGVIIVAELDTLRRVPIEERPLYDEASLYLALMLDLAAQRLATRYRALGDGKLREYQLQPAGEQRVDSALGEIAVVGVKRERAGKDRRTVLWCAPDLRYLPVLIIQERKGTEVLRMTLSELQGLSIP